MAVYVSSLKVSLVISSEVSCSAMKLFISWGSKHAWSIFVVICAWAHSDRAAWVRPIQPDHDAKYGIRCEPSSAVIILAAPESGCETFGTAPEGSATRRHWAARRTICSSLWSRVRVAARPLQYHQAPLSLWGRLCINIIRQTIQVCATRPGLVQQLSRHQRQAARQDRTIGHALNSPGEGRAFDDDELPELRRAESGEARALLLVQLLYPYEQLRP
jgi:hypothetical protein